MTTRGDLNKVTLARIARTAHLTMWVCVCVCCSTCFVHSFDNLVPESLHVNKCKKCSAYRLDDWFTFNTKNRCWCDAILFPSPFRFEWNLDGPWTSPVAARYKCCNANVMKEIPFDWTRRFQKIWLWQINVWCVWPVLLLPSIKSIRLFFLSASQ